MTINSIHREMTVEYKCIVPQHKVNRNGTTKGAYIFELMDLGAVTRLGKLFIDDVKTLLVTSDSTIKFIEPVYAFDYIEVRVGVINITSSKIDAEVCFYHRNPNSLEWSLAATGEFGFSLIHTDTKKLVRIPKDVINEIKG